MQYMLNQYVQNSSYLWIACLALHIQVADVVISCCVQKFVAHYHVYHVIMCVYALVCYPYKIV